jgi:hypothetical protein
VSERTKECTKCRISKPVSEFYNNAARPDGKMSNCKECKKAYDRENRGKQSSRHREWKARNKEQQKAYRAEYRPRALELRELNREKVRAQANAWNRRMQDAAIDAYGGFCACCGETERTFLQIDHVNDDGAEHRRMIKGARLAPWLRKNGYPEGFRVLCANCNFGRHINGGACPHETTVGQVIL